MQPFETLERRRLFNAVTGFTLINPQTDLPIATLSDGATINLADLPGGALNIRAHVDNRSVQSVQFGLDKKSHFAVENAAPYALFSDSGGDYHGGALSVGSHTLKATPYARDDAKGKSGSSKTIHFTVINQERPQVTQFLLIDADTDQVIERIDEGDTFNLATLPTRNLNVEVKTTGPAGSVRIGLDRITRVENAAAWAYFGNTGSDFHAGALSVGAHRLTAIAFTADNAAGISGALQSVNFTVTDEPPAPPDVFMPGAFTTLRQTEWDTSTLLQTAEPFGTAFTQGLTVGTFGAPGRFSILLTDGPAVRGYLSTGGANVALTANHVNPTSGWGGQLGGEITGLLLNIGFSDAGILTGTFGLPFGDLTLHNLAGLPGLEGMSLRDFATLANRAIGGEATGYSLDTLNVICAELNDSFLSHPTILSPSAWAQAHLRAQ